MTISSRTPEGEPKLCPICRKFTLAASSNPIGDSCCASCGKLLKWFRARFYVEPFISHGDELPAEIEFSTPLVGDQIFNSLELVNLVMDLELEFDVQVSETDLQQIATVQDAIRFIQQHRRDKS